MQAHTYVPYHLLVDIFCLFSSERSKTAGILQAFVSLGLGCARMHRCNLIIAVSPAYAIQHCEYKELAACS